MGAELAASRYGKAETRIVRVDRTTPTHAVTDLNVSVALTGDLAATHLTGDNANVLPTDTQKNTVYAFARDGIPSIEAFALRLARHFVDTQPAIHASDVRIESYAWQRLGDHSFSRPDGGEVRTAGARYDGGHATVTAGLTGLLLLNSTDSEFHGFAVDDYTTLPPTADRILATAVDASWTYGGDDLDWDKAYRTAREALVEAFTGTYSYSLQQTLYAMGKRLIDQVPEASEVTLVLPNKHHFLVDLAPFGLDNPGEVFLAADRPYGLIEGTVRRT
ncbi:urate oxidase [Flindersiella endophytica]